MDIYICSRGLSIGYSWVNHQSKEIDPPYLDRFIHIIDSTAFSVVIYCNPNDGKILLLVTGLKSSRTDNRTRTIHSSVVWVGRAEEEPQLRAIAVQALRGELTQIVDNVTRSDRSRGFIVEDWKALRAFDLRSIEHNSPDTTPKIGNLSNLKEPLIQELQKCYLPKKSHPELLVVVSPTVTKNNLKEYRVWRGLSNAIESDGWEEYQITSENSQGNLLKDLMKGNFWKDVMRRVSVVVAVLLLVVSVSGNVWLNNKVNNLQEQIQELQEEKIENQKLKEKNKDLEDKNIKLNDENQYFKDIFNIINNLQNKNISEAQSTLQKYASQPQEDERMNTDEN